MDKSQATLVSPHTMTPMEHIRTAFDSSGVLYTVREHQGDTYFFRGDKFLEENWLKGREPDEIPFEELSTTYGLVHYMFNEDGLIMGC